MKRVKLSVIVFILLLLMYSVVYAAPIGNPSDPKTPSGDGVAKLKNSIGNIKVSIDAEHIDERELEGASGNTDGKLEGQWYLARFGYPLFEDVLEPYVKVGVSHLQTSWKDSGGGFVRVKGDNTLAWGVGARFLAYELPQYRLRFVLDGQYRRTDPDMDNVVVNDPSRTVSATDFKVGEWQIGGIISMEFPLGQPKSRFGKTDIYSLIPYVGVAYADSDTTTKFTYNNIAYNIGDNTEARHKAVLITGCDLTCPQNLSLNVESRLVGETSVSGGATVKF